jgi:hypothetical protein
MPFSTVQCVFTVKHYFQMQLYEADKQVYQVHFPDAAVPNKSVILLLDNQWCHSLQSFYKFVGMGWVMSTTGWGTFSTHVVIT